jgi:hypothetical protein
MQLMLGIYEFPDDPATAEHTPAQYPKEFVIDYVRGYRRRSPIDGSAT